MISKGPANAGPASTRISHSGGKCDNMVLNVIISDMGYHHDKQKTACTMNWPEQLGLTIPLVQAPMAGVSTPALAVAVSQAGGLGSIGVGAAGATVAHEMICQVRQQTGAPFNVNLFVHKAPEVDPVCDKA